MKVMTIKHWFKNILAMLVGFLIIFVFLEILIRVSPKNTIYIPDSTLTFSHDKNTGFRLTPNQRASYNIACTRTPELSVNQYGFRGHDWMADDGYSIAILGDSFMLAAQLPEGIYTAPLLEKILNKKVHVNVLNTGILDYNTITELFVYNYYLRPLRPKIVILFFLTLNDIKDNNCKMLQDDRGGIINQPCGQVADDGTIVYKTSFPEISPDLKPHNLKALLRTYCLSCTLLKRLLGNAIDLGQKYHAVGRWEVYTPPKTTDWADAWKITEKAIADIKNSVEATGGRLLIVSVPEHLKTTKKWEDEFLEMAGLREIPPDFDPLYPTRKIKDIADENRVLFLELESYFITYRDRFNLTYPYFSFWCDGHWNPLGHYLAAQITAKFMIENDMLSYSKEDRKQLLNFIENNLNRSPIEILGSDAYQQIYNRGVYSGGSNIQNILNAK